MATETRPMRRRAADWTDDELATLAAYYPKYGAKFVAKIVGKTPSAVMTRALRLGLLRASKQWTEAELEALAAYYPEHGADYVGKLVDKTPSAVRSRANRLGITRRETPKRRKRRKQWTEADLETLAAYYPTHGAKFVAKLVDKSTGNVTTRANRLGLLRVRAGAWTEADLETLAAYYPTHGAKFVAKLVNRSVDSVRQEASRRRLARRYPPKKRPTPPERRRNRKPWTEADVETLREQYPLKGAKYLANLLGRTKATVIARAKQLGVSRIYWTDVDDDILRRYYPENGPAFVASMLKRSRCNVQVRAKFLGVQMTAEAIRRSHDKRNAGLIGRVMPPELRAKYKAARNYEAQKTPIFRSLSITGQRRRAGDAARLMIEAAAKLSTLTEGEPMTTTLDLVRQTNDAKWLIAELRRSLDVTIQNVRQCAAIVCRLDELGVAVPPDIPFVEEFRKIGRGKMLDALFIKHIDCSDLLRRASRLAIAEQRALASDEPLKVVKANGVVADVRPSELTKDERKQVIGTAGLRNVEAQKTIVAQRAEGDKTRDFAEARFRLNQLRETLKRLDLAAAAAPHLSAIEQSLAAPIAPK